MQLFRALRETEGVCDGHEISQVTEFHFR